MSHTTLLLKHFRGIVESGFFSHLWRWKMSLSFSTSQDWNLSTYSNQGWDTILLEHSSSHRLIVSVCILLQAIITKTCQCIRVFLFPIPDHPPYKFLFYTHWKHFLSKYIYHKNMLCHYAVKKARQYGTCHKSSQSSRISTTGKTFVEKEMTL